jgi:hypothetical protein
MKKLLIPIIGLLVLIFLTPVIIGKMANSNIDKKIEMFKKDGIKITEVKKDIGYLTTNRVFEVTFDKDTKNKTWKVYNKVINQAKFQVNLTFKNLPITTAKFDVNTKYVNILNHNYLQGLKAYITSKDFKTFNYKIYDYNKLIKIIGLNGTYENKKYAYNNFNIKKLAIGNLLVSNDNKAKFIVKDLNLGLVDYNWKSKNWNIKYGNINIKGENTEENLSTHLMPNNFYNIDDKVLSDKLGVDINGQVVAVTYFDWNLNFKNFKKDSLKNSDLTLSVLWSETEYHKVVVGGGEIKIKAHILQEIPQTLNDVNLDATIRFDKDLFQTITKDFDPAVVNKYFKNYTSHIEIKNGELLINGNRVQ